MAMNLEKAAKLYFGGKKRLDDEERQRDQRKIPTLAYLSILEGYGEKPHQTHFKMRRWRPAEEEHKFTCEWEEPDPGLLPDPEPPAAKKRKTARPRKKDI